MRSRLAQGLALSLLIASLGAAQGPNSSEAIPTPSSSVQRKSGVRKQAGKHQPYQVGTASWYGEYFEGRPTASGEPYEMHELTAAHPALPLGSYVRVTNLRNGRVVVVRINDRGPIVPGRIIDLSYGAAEVLQFRSRGLQRVRLDVLDPQQAKPHYQAVALNTPPAKLP